MACMAITFMDMACSIIIGIIIVHLSSDIKLSIAIYSFIIISVFYYSSFLRSSINMEYLLALIWPSFSTLAFFESLYSVNIRYVSSKIVPELIISTSFAKYMAIIVIYYFIVWRKLYQNRFEELVDSHKQEKESLLTNKTFITNKR